MHLWATTVWERQDTLNFHNVIDVESKQVTHIWMFLPEGPGSLPGAQTDHPHTRSFDKRNSGRSARLVGILKQSISSMTLMSPGGFSDWAGGSLPWSHTPRSHSMQSASVSGQAQAWVLRHFLLWQTQASQKSHTAPLWTKARLKS